MQVFFTIRTQTLTHTRTQYKLDRMYLYIYGVVCFDFVLIFCFFVLFADERQV